MWQTLVSKVSRRNWTPRASSAARISATLSQHSGPGLAFWGTNGIPCFCGSQCRSSVAGPLVRLSVFVWAQPQETQARRHGSRRGPAWGHQELESFDDIRGRAFDGRGHGKEVEGLAGRIRAAEPLG